MTISGPSMTSKWENLQNSRVFKHLFSSHLAGTISRAPNIEVPPDTERSHLRTCLSFSTARLEELRTHKVEDEVLHTGSHHQCDPMRLAN